MQQEASTFSALLEGAELMVPELFSCAWPLWSASMRSYLADPTAAAAELQAAAAIFGFLAASADELSDKQNGQVQIARAMIGELKAMIVVSDHAPSQYNPAAAESVGTSPAGLPPAPVRGRGRGRGRGTRGGRGRHSEHAGSAYTDGDTQAPLPPPAPHPQSSQSILRMQQTGLPPPQQSISHAAPPPQVAQSSMLQVPSKQKKPRRRDLSSLAEQLEEVECLETMYPDGSYDELRDKACAARREPEAEASLQPLHLRVTLPILDGCLEVNLKLPDGYPLKKPPTDAELSCRSLSREAMTQLLDMLNRTLKERHVGEQVLVRICEGLRRRANEMLHCAVSPESSTANDGSGRDAPAATATTSNSVEDKWGEKLSRKLVLNHSTHLDGLLRTLVKLDEACSRHGLVIAKMVPAQLKKYKGVASTVMSLKVREEVRKLSGFELRAHKGGTEQVVFLVIRGFDQENEAQTERQLEQLQAGIAECTATSTVRDTERASESGKAKAEADDDTSQARDEPSDAERAARKARILAFEYSGSDRGRNRNRGIDDDLGPRPQDLNASRAQQLSRANRDAHKERHEQTKALQKQRKDELEIASAERKLRANKDFMKSSGIRVGSSDKASNSKEAIGSRIKAEAMDAKQRGRI